MGQLTREHAPKTFNAIPKPLRAQDGAERLPSVGAAEKPIATALRAMVTYHLGQLASAHPFNFGSVVIGFA